MALHIKGDKWTEWHVGQQVPPIKARVVIFQADGDELYMILDAMKRTSQPIIDVEPSPQLLNNGECTRGRQVMTALPPECIVIKCPVHPDGHTLKELES